MSADESANNEKTNGKAAAEDPSAGEGGGLETLTLADAIQQRDRYLELAQRTRAEFENYQKRVTRDLQTERKYAILPLARELLPVLDNLDRAIDSMKGASEAKGLLVGIEMVRKMFVEGLARHGIEQIDATEVPFDPNFHEAVMQQPSADKPPLTVLTTLQAGYKLHDRVVRPAQVVVSTAVAGSKRHGEESANE